VDHAQSRHGAAPAEAADEISPRLHHRQSLLVCNAPCHPAATACAECSEDFPALGTAIGSQSVSAASLPTGRFARMDRRHAANPSVTSLDESVSEPS
jgi:hypothetical protein